MPSRSLEDGWGWGGGRPDNRGGREGVVWRQHPTSLELGRWGASMGGVGGGGKIGGVRTAGKGPVDFSPRIVFLKIFSSLSHVEP